MGVIVNNTKETYNFKFLWPSLNSSQVLRIKSLNLKSVILKKWRKFLTKDLQVRRIFTNLKILQDERNKIYHNRNISDYYSRGD